MAAARKLRVYAPAPAQPAQPRPPRPPEPPPPEVDEERELEFARPPLAMLRDTRLTPAERLVGAELVAHLNGHARYVIARDGRMATNLGMSRPFINRALAKLERLGWIAREADHQRAAGRKIRLRFRLKRSRQGCNPSVTPPVTDGAQPHAPARTPVKPPGDRGVRAGARQLKTPDSDPGSRDPRVSDPERREVARPEGGPPPPPQGAGAEADDPAAIADVLEEIRAKLAPNLAAMKGRRRPLKP